MSNSVDQRIVEMQFDNASFEKNVATTMSTLKKLESSLDLKGGVDALTGLDAAVANVDFSGMAKGVDDVANRMSAMGIVGATVLNRLTNAAIDVGGKALKAATIDPLTDGLDEYTLKLNSIKTIQANTGLKDEAGLAQIKAVLGDLNTYADKTIYNFAEMTRNIGTFTAAGVGLNESAEAIKGIANLAAISGSNSQQASVAMYQLSQALASGSVKLQDWNSVVNAGMGGKVFQNALIETSRALGTGADEYIAAEGSFRTSLTKGWVTSEVLAKTLRNFTLEATEANREMLLGEGYTQEQIDNIFEMASTATEAATKVKTFQQLVDTTKEALGSGWAETWEYIIGDIKQAEELWTWASNGLNDIIGKFSDARNEFFRAWNEGDESQGIASGWTSMFETLKEIAGIASDLAQPVIDAFNAIFEPLSGLEAAQATANLLEFVRGLREALNHSTTGQAILSTIGLAFTALFAIIKIGITIVKTAISIIVHVVGAGLVLVADLIEMLFNGLKSLVDFLSGVDIGSFFEPIADFLSNTLHADGLVQFFRDIGKAIGDFINAVASGKGPMEAFSEFFDSVGQTTSGAFSGLTSGLSGIVDSLKGMRDAAAPVVLNGLSKALETLGKIWTRLEPVFAAIRDKLVGAWNAIVEAFQNAGFSFDPFINLFDSFGQAFSTFIDSLAEGDGLSFDSISKLFGGLVDGIGEFLKSAGEPILNFFGELGGKIAEGLGGPFKALYDWVAGIKDPLDSITGGLSNLVDSLVNLPKNIVFPWSGTKDNADDLATAVDKGYNAVNKFTEITDAVMHPAKTVAKIINEVFKTIKNSINEFVSNLELEGIDQFIGQMGKVALLGGAAVGILEIVKVLDTISTVSKSVSASLQAIATSFSGLGKALQGNLKMAALLHFAVAIGILVASLFALSKIDPERLVPSMAALLTLVVLMMAIVNEIAAIPPENMANVAAFGSTALGLAAAIGILALVVAVLGRLDPGQLQQGVIVVGVLAVIIGGLAWITSKSAGLQGAGLALLEMAAAIAILTAVAVYLSQNWQSAIIGAAMVLGLLGILALIALMLDSMPKVKAGVGSSTIMNLAAALIGISVAMAALTAIVHMDPAAAGQAFQMILWMLALLAGISLALSNFTAGGEIAASAGAIVAMCASLLLIAAAVAGLTAAITLAGAENVEIAAAIIAACLISLAFAVGIMAAAGPQAEVATAAIIGLCAAVALIATAIAVMSTMDLNALGSAATILVVSIVAIAVAAAALFAVASYFTVGIAAVTVFAVGLGIAAVLIAAGTLLMATALEKIAVSGPAAVDAFLASISTLGQGLWNAKDDIAMGIAGLASGIISGLASIGPAVAVASAELVVNMANGFTAAVPQLADAAMRGIVILVSSIAEGLHTYAPALGQALMQLGYVVLEGVVTILTDALASVMGLIDQLIESISGESPHLADAAKELGHSAVEGLETEMQNMDTTALDEVKQTAAALASGKGQLQSTGQANGAAIKQGMVNGVSGTAEGIQAQLSGIPGITGNAGAGAMDAIQKAMGGGVDMSNIVSQFEEAGIVIPEMGDKAGAGFATSMQESVAAVDVSDTLMQEIDSGAIVEKMRQAGIDAAEGFNSGFHDSANIDGSTLDISSLEDSGRFSEAATACANAFTTALSNGLSSVSSIASSAGSAAVSSFTSGAGGGWGAGYSVGYNLSAGVAAGMWAGYGSVAAAAASIIEKIDEVLRKKSEMHSPSKMTARVGRYLAEGLAVGMIDREQYVVNTAGNLMASVLKSMSTDLVDALADDITENPTIRPILDLDEYMAGVQAMSDMMPTDQYAMAGRIMGYSAASSPFGNSNTNSAFYEINLHYTKDADANQMVEDLTRELHSKNLMEAH